MSNTFKQVIMGLFTILVSSIFGMINAYNHRMSNVYISIFFICTAIGLLLYVLYQNDDIGDDNER